MPAITRKGDVESGHDCHFPPTPATGGSPDVFVIGNENWVLRYDHLSNIHYGYVLGACGIDLKNAVRMASMAPLGWTGNTEDPSDEIATHIGLALYKNHPTGITANQLWMELKRYRTQKYAIQRLMLAALTACGPS